MLELEADLRQPNDAERALLRAYSAAEAELASAASPSMPQSADGANDESVDRRRWIARLPAVDGLPPEELAPSHGRLIAAGYLQFQVGDRNQGLVYRLSPEGRAVLGECPSNEEAA